MNIAVSRWNETSEAVQSEWAGLVEGGRYNPSLHPGWLQATLLSHQLAERALVVTLRSPDGLLVAPLLQNETRVLGVRFRTLDLATNVVGYHAAIPASGDFASKLEHVLRSRDLPAWDAIRLANLPIDSTTACAARELGARIGGGVLTLPGQQSPYIPMTQAWDAFIADRPKKLRANISRAARLMREAGESEVRWYERGADPAQVLRDILAVEARSWKAREGSAITEQGREHRYYEQLMPWLSANALLANVLYVAGKPAAYVLCAQWHGWIGQLKTSFDESLRDAGLRVIHTSIERAFELRGLEYDFLGDAAAHKLRWTDKVRAHEDVWIFAPHWRGRAFAQLKRLSSTLRARLPAKTETEAHD